MDKIDRRIENLHKGNVDERFEALHREMNERFEGILKVLTETSKTQERGVK